ncbi:hypothetical protein [uncultured Legionella sp.]|uniref:hypothetical protein n=1 Tax=uncultured Legionella sp. TaxID=210934 RepID=UPI002628E349|nr:hypothetical protein [uncultured Legionella sp.]
MPEILGEPIGIGGIFLRPRVQILQANQRFFHSQSVPRSAKDISTQIRTYFLDSHRHYAGLEPLKDIDFVTIYLNGSLSLWGKKNDNKLYEINSQETPALQDEYNIIKSVSHSTVWLHLILQSIIGHSKINKHHQIDLQRLEFSLLDLYALSQRMSRERTVIQQILNYVYLIPEMKHLTEFQALYTQYLVAVKSVNEVYASKATQLQLNGIHHIMSQWTDAYKIQLGAMRVLIVTAHGPRNDLIEKQYFLDLYEKQGFMDAECGSAHILCVEMMPEQSATISKESLIDFLRKHQINMQIAANMLGDPMAMDKDILGQYAPGVLKKLCPFHETTSTNKEGRFSFFPRSRDLEQPNLLAPHAMQLKE